MIYFAQKIYEYICVEIDKIAVCKGKETSKKLNNKRYKNYNSFI